MTVIKGSMKMILIKGTYDDDDCYSVHIFDEDK
jgi:hypothetical protein